MIEFMTGQGARPLILVMLLLARCKWVIEIEGFGISTNWLFSKLIERREKRPPKAPLFTCFNRLWLRLIFSSVGILPNVEDCNWELICEWLIRNYWPLGKILSCEGLSESIKKALLWKFWVSFRNVCRINSLWIIGLKLSMFKNVTRMIDFLLIQLLIVDKTLFFKFHM